MFLLGLAFALQGADDPVARCARAERVVVAEVTSAETTWAEGPAGDLTTTHWLAVEHTLRGEPTDTLEVTTRGGARDGLVQTVEDEATLRLDHRYLLLLARDGDTWRVVDGEHGVVAVPHGVEVALPAACRP